MRKIEDPHFTANTWWSHEERKKENTEKKVEELHLAKATHTANTIATTTLHPLKQTNKKKTSRPSNFPVT